MVPIRVPFGCRRPPALEEMPETAGPQPKDNGKTLKRLLLWGLLLLLILGPPIIILIFLGAL